MTVPHKWGAQPEWSPRGETTPDISNCARPASSASRGDNEVDHAVCLKVEFHMHTDLSNENG